MHDIDRTQREFEASLHAMQPEIFDFQEFEDSESEFQQTYEEEGPSDSYETESDVGEEEADEMEQAAYLLEVQDEAQLDQFLGNLIRKVGRKVGRVVQSPLGNAIGGVLRPVAKVALPIAGRTLGTFVGGPVGGVIGGRLASTAGRMFGLELEGLTVEDREFEVARRYVRFASAAIRNALGAPSRSIRDPYAIAKAGAAAAARQFAPGLAGFFGEVGGTSPTASNGVVPAGSRRQGTWIRRGRRIILLGA
jgi:hypothetical protein